MKGELELRLFHIEMTQEELGAKIGRSKTYVSFRMTGKREWEMRDVYAICDVLGIDYSEIPKFFPPKTAEKKLSVFKNGKTA